MPTKKKTEKKEGETHFAGHTCIPNQLRKENFELTRNHRQVVGYDGKGVLGNFLNQFILNTRRRPRLEQGEYCIHLFIQIVPPKSMVLTIPLCHLSLPIDRQSEQTPESII